ncbi:hypothetical protein IMZ48_07190 [Candidatus Bathyarchaeota archaeon]|nr:hypothetical protein [Candidatus Bathyarchaeota archaeon]
MRQLIPSASHGLRRTLATSPLLRWLLVGDLRFDHRGRDLQGFFLGLPLRRCPGPHGGKGTKTPLVRRNVVYDLCV